MRALKWLFLIVVLLVLIGGVLAWTMPAEFAYRMVGARMAPALLSGVQGTVWDGRADGLSVFGRDLGELDWRVSKAPMLHGETVSDLHIQGTDIEAAGIVTRAFSGDISLRDVRFRFPASLVAPSLDIPALKLLGTITGALNQARLIGGVLQDATGSARWSEAGVTGQAEARFSDILIDFSSKPDGSITGVAKDDGQGNLEVNGLFDVSRDAFNAEVKLSARNGDPRVLDTLRYVGQQQADGSSILIVHGKLFQLF